MIAIIKSTKTLHFTHSTQQNSLRTKYLTFHSLFKKSSKPKLRSRYHRTFYSIPQIINLGPSDWQHSHHTITKKGTQTSKRGCTYPTFRDFHPFTYLVKTLFLNYIPSQVSTFLSIFVLLKELTLTYILKSPPFVVYTKNTPLSLPTPY